MSVAALRFAPWHDKTHLPPTKYASLTAAVSRVLFHAVFVPENNLDIGWARTFVRSYAQDAAAYALQVLDGQEGSDDTKPSPEELSIRKLTLQLAGRTARVKGGLGVSVLVDLAVAYGTRNATFLKMVFEEACKSTPSLLEELKMELVPAFRTILQDTEHGSPKTIRKAAYVLSQLLHIMPHGFTPFTEDQEFVLVLSRCYQIGLDSLAASRGGMTVEPMESSAEWRKDWLYAKVGLLDSFHAIVQGLLPSRTLPEAESRLFDIIFAILQLPPPSTSPPSPSTPFVSQSLLADYQYAFDFSSVLNERFRGTDDARVDLLAATLADLAPSFNSPKPSGGLSVLLQGDNWVKKAVLPSGPNGESKPIKQDPHHDVMLDLAVSKVLEIFPTYTPQHIRHCLEHPTFCGDPEKLTSSLLEGTLPLELTNQINVVSKSVSPVEEFEFIKNRRNVWDNDTMDFSRLRVGKTRNDADSLLQDRSFVEYMKADIIRRVQEVSDEEDEPIERLPERIVTYNEELDDDAESLVDKGVKVTGDGEASDESDADADADVGDMSSPGNVLELAYLEDPKVFGRDGATRRSKFRAELKAKTGWCDEQVEGWRIMLERNPKKDEILQKFEFAGNTPLASNKNVSEPGPSVSSRGQSSQRGRGRDGRGNSRGAGRGSDAGNGGASDTARGRTWKDKNKAMNTNHRKRGHDKKMARGDTGPPR